MQSTKNRVSASGYHAPLGVISNHLDQILENWTLVSIAKPLPRIMACPDAVVAHWTCEPALEEGH